MAVVQKMIFRQETSTAKEMIHAPGSMQVHASKVRLETSNIINIFRQETSKAKKMIDAPGSTSHD